jgi:hypothetical protein
MYACQWHLDVPFGKQGAALAVMAAWGAEKLRSSGFRKVRGTRVMVGHVGASAAHVVDEYLFDSLADFEAALADMGQEKFRTHAEALAPYIVPGSQRWVVWRIVEPKAG